MRNAHVNYELPLVEVPVWTLKTAEPFCNLFPIRPTVLSQIIDDMNKNGYDACQPIVVWNMTVVDGHTRLRAAVAAGIETVPVICRRFADEDEALDVKEIEEGVWEIDGATDLYRVEHTLQADDLVDDDQEYSTLNGLIMEHLGTVPEVGQTLELRGFRFEVVAMDGQRIVTVRITRIKEDE